MTFSIWRLVPESGIYIVMAVVCPKEFTLNYIIKGIYCHVPAGWGLQQTTQGYLKIRPVQSTAF